MLPLLYGQQQGLFLERAVHVLVRLCVYIPAYCLQVSTCKRCVRYSVLIVYLQQRCT